ncbi:MAG: M24 family metallopeptidase, partial [Clostridiales bacterium]|nr:M24 family metallopeptidase [Clostridiales bacterium]
MKRAKKVFDGAGADVLLIQADFLRRYLTGFASTDGYVVVEKDKCTLVVDSRYSEAAEKQLSGSDIKIVEGVYATAEELIKDYKVVGVPYPFLSLTDAGRLTDRGFTLKDCMPAFKAAMMIKSAEEIALIQRACTIAEEGLLKLLPEIKEGMTESETAALLEYNMRSLGAEGVSFDTIVAFGANGSVPHHETGRDKLKFGDPVLIDFGCKVEG